MTMRPQYFIRIAALAALAGLAACGGANGNEVAELDNELLSNNADPALTSALEDQILVDPTLSQQSNSNAVRPPETPVQAQYPAAGQPEATRAAQIRGGSSSSSSRSPIPGGVCGGDLNYGAEWARRLPAEFPPYPGGQLTEAAGNDVPGCRIRVVSFRSGDRFTQVLDWYQARAARAGFSAERQMRDGDHVLGGYNAATEGAYYLIVTPRPNGSDVALVVNNGR